MSVAKRIDDDDQGSRQELGERLKEARRYLGLKQDEVAQYLIIETGTGATTLLSDIIPGVKLTAPRFDLRDRDSLYYESEGNVYRLIVSSKLPGACPFTFPGEKAL